MSIYRAVMNSIQSLDFTLEYEDPSNGMLQARTRTSFFSWGEDIQIRITSIEQYRTKVEVRSTAHSQLISWGKNEENESELLRQIHQRLI